MPTRTDTTPILRKAIDAYAEYTGWKVVVADGFDEAIVGLAESEPFKHPRVAYCKAKMVKVLVKEGMTQDEAIEYLEFNTWGAYVGTSTPIWLETLPLLQPYIDEVEPLPRRRPLSKKAKGKSGVGKVQPLPTKAAPKRTSKDF
jgi:hypothetical protein